MRSPELVASSKPAAREAWGQGHVGVDVVPGKLQMTAEDIADPKAKGLFNLSLALWKTKMVGDLRVLQAHLQNLTVATRLVAFASPLTHEFYERKEEGGARLGMKARRDTHGVQKLSLLITDEYEIREFLLRNNRGERVVARFTNERSELTGGKCVFDTVVLRVEKGGETQVFHADLDYVKAGEHVVHGRIAMRLEDGEGKLVRERPNTVNPVSYRFSKHQVR
jgi:hypothetical protein